VTARRKEDYVDFVDDPERDIIVVQGFEGETESLPILAKRLNQGKNIFYLLLYVCH
jgi:hypothetical protein